VEAAVKSPIKVNESWGLKVCHSFLKIWDGCGVEQVFLKLAIQNKNKLSFKYFFKICTS